MHEYFEICQIWHKIWELKWACIGKEMNPKIKIHKYPFRFQFWIREVGGFVLEGKNEIYNAQVDIFQIREIFALKEIEIILMGARFSNHSDMD